CTSHARPGAGRRAEAPLVRSHPGESGKRGRAGGTVHRRGSRLRAGQIATWLNLDTRDREGKFSCSRSSCLFTLTGQSLLARRASPASDERRAFALIYYIAAADNSPAPRHRVSPIRADQSTELVLVVT